MSEPVETTAAMTVPGDATAAVTAESAAPEPQRSTSLAGATQREPLAEYAMSCLNPVPLPEPAA